MLKHRHAHHIYGMPAVLFHRWLAGYAHKLDVYANGSTLTMVQVMCRGMSQPAWHLVPETPNYDLLHTDHFSVLTTPGVHAMHTPAVKIVDHDTGRTPIYFADTRPDTGIVAFAPGAQSLFHEATSNALKDIHSSPRQAGDVALQDGVERLILVHYSSQYTMPEAEAIGEAQGAGFSGSVEVGYEFDSYVA
ncbi:MAG: hypothetical protein NVS2B7_09890 [Herpetosiphon sp.]